MKLSHFNKQNTKRRTKKSKLVPIKIPMTHLGFPLFENDKSDDKGQGHAAELQA